MNVVFSVTVTEVPFYIPLSPGAATACERRRRHRLSDCERDTVPRQEDVALARHCAEPFSTDPSSEARRQDELLVYFCSPCGLKKALFSILDWPAARRSTQLNPFPDGQHAEGESLS